VFFFLFFLWRCDSSFISGTLRVPTKNEDDMAMNNIINDNYLYYIQPLVLQNIYAKASGNIYIIYVACNYYNVLSTLTNTKLCIFIRMLV